MNQQEINSSSIGIYQSNNANVSNNEYQIADKVKPISSKNEFRKLLAPKPIAPDNSYATFVTDDEVVADKLDEHISSQISKRQTAIQKHIEEHKGFFFLLYYFCFLL